MIKVNNLIKKYGETVVLNNANFTIPLNKITCVLGGSGEGKTTLLNILSGLTTYEGSIENLPNNPSFVFQEHRLILNKTVMQNLIFFTGVENEQIIQKFLEKVNLLHKQNAVVSNLSGGEKQRVAIARALIKNSNFILIDEPFSALDVSLKLSVAKLIKHEVKSVNSTAVIVTHDINLALQIADEILIVKNGSVSSLNLIKNSLTKEEVEKIITNAISS
jgi:ABC-type nitrate/sulfonate/bicarbonate transport system ATPase subunit